MRHRTRHAPWEGGGPRNGEGLSASPDASAPLCASRSVGVWRRVAQGYFCDTYMQGPGTRPDVFLRTDSSRNVLDNPEGPTVS
jgi:hypothetical protein